MLPSPLLRLPGAQADAQAAAPQVPAHYGAPLREQARFVAGRALCALERDCVSVSGPDRLTWLTSLSSQILTDLQPGDGGREALILDAQGHIRFALAVIDTQLSTLDSSTAPAPAGEGCCLLLTDAGSGPALAEFLDSMRFMLRVEVEQRPSLQVVAARGEAATYLAAHPAVAGVWRDPWPGVTPGGTAYCAPGTEPTDHPGRDWEATFGVVEQERVGDVLRDWADARGAQMSGCVAGAHAWDALRIEAGRPEAHSEADSRAIPNELDWLRTAVHLDKGCYPGQETIARTINLGKPPRRLTLLQVDGLLGATPRVGDAVLLGERPVGRVTSVGRHYELGTIALALLRRAVPPQEILSIAVTEDSDEGDAATTSSIVGYVSAAQELLVSPEGKAQASPSERPGAELRRRL